MPKGSVSIMLSYDYCHFEIQLTSDEDMTLDQIDNMRKDAQRLADKAVLQYQIAKEMESKRAELAREKEYLAMQVKAIRKRPQKEWTPEEMAKVKALENAKYWSQFEYDYEDEEDEY